MPQVGSIAPEFALPTHDNDYIKLGRRLDQIVEGGHIVIFFFLNAGSPGCTREVSSFQERIAEYRRRNISVIGISPDPVSALAAFGAEQKVEFPLCSDMDHAAATDWGTWMDGRQMRSSFVIDSRGVVVHAFPRVNVNTHAAELLDLLPAGDAAPAEASAAEAPVEHAAHSASHEATSHVAAAAPPIVAAAGGGLQAGDVAIAFARTSLQLLLAHAESGGRIPADVADLASRVASKRQ